MLTVKEMLYLDVIDIQPVYVVTDPPAQPVYVVLA